MDRVLSAFRGFPSQEKVAMMMLAHGISVRDGTAYCGDIRLSDSALGRAAGVDRRVIRSTMERIRKDARLSSLFSGLRSIALFSDVAAEIGCTTLEIVPTDAMLPGILAEVTAIIYRAGVSVRQAVVDDPGFNDDAHLIVVLEGSLPSEYIPMIKEARGVSRIIIR